MAMLNIASLPKHLDEIRLLLHDKNEPIRVRLVFVCTML